MITMGDVLSKWELQEYEYKAKIADLRRRIEELEEENEDFRDIISHSSNDRHNG